MTKVRVIIDNLLLEESAPNTIVSVLYVGNDDICFPSHKWIELSSSVLDMWSVVEHRGTADELVSRFIYEPPVGMSGENAEIVLQNSWCCCSLRQRRFAEFAGWCAAAGRQLAGFAPY